MKRYLTVFLFFSLFIAASSAAALKDQILYMHPGPDAQYVNPQTNLILRLKNAVLSDRPQFFIQGSKSGVVSGHLKISRHPLRFLFYPDHPFQKETVSVTILLGSQRYSYQFSTYASVPLESKFMNPGDMEFNSNEATEKDTKSSDLSVKTMGEPSILANGVSVPSDFPYIEVTVNESPDPGKIFLNNWANNQPPYLMIFNNDGTPYWYQRTPQRQRDFKVQQNGLLTSRWIPSFENAPGGAFMAMDSTYAVVDTFYSGPGYYVDEHELMVLPNGHYLIVVDEYIQDYDMSAEVEGGKEHANIKLYHFQELDENDQVVFTWRCIEPDHFSFKDADEKQVNVRDSGFEYPHINSIDVDEDSNLVISSRRISEVTKINWDTGKIIWRLGGKKNQFTFIGDEFNGLSGQHACRVLGDGHYLLFDNGNGRTPAISRAVEYAIDTLAMTATLVWEYRQEPGTANSYYMGNAQRLPNGNTLINWAVASRPKATEITPDGDKVYEMNFIRGADCYRTQKFDWNVPAVKPYLIIESGTTGATLLFNQFGDPDVDYYNIYHGTDLHPTDVLDTSKLTMKTFENLENKQYHFFRVTSVSKTGEESDYSNEDAVMIKIMEPDENQVLNGDFSDGDKFWYYGGYGAISVTGSAADSVFHLTLNVGSDGLIYLYQYPMELKKNGMYIFDFDAWANKTMTIQPMVSNSNGQTDYAQIGNVQITAEPEHYSFEFTKKSATTTEALVLFLFQQGTGEFYVDNVSLKEIVSSGMTQESQNIPKIYRLERNTPNPFNGETSFRFYVPQPSEVTFIWYDILGQRVREIHQGMVQAGEHRLIFKDEQLGSGVYFCRMEAKDNTGKLCFDRVMKMVLIK